MTAPNVTMTPEPEQNGSVVYLPLSAPTSESVENGQLSLTLTLQNHEPNALHLSRVVLSFANPTAPPKPIPADLDLGVGASELWFHGPADNVLLQIPAPSDLTIGLKFDGFSDLVTSTFPLRGFVSPLPGGAYAFPARFSDLTPGEYWSGRSAGHRAAGGGVQLFGYDMGVIRYDKVSSAWTAFVPGGSASKNEDYLVWGSQSLQWRKARFNPGSTVNRRTRVLPRISRLPGPPREITSTFSMERLLFFTRTCSQGR